MRCLSRPRCRTGDQLPRGDFVEVLRAEGGANLILDMVGGDYLPRNVKCLADEGRLVQIAFLQGPKVELNFRAGDDAPADDHRQHPAPAKRPGQGADCRGAARPMSGRYWSRARWPR